MCVCVCMYHVMFHMYIDKYIYMYIYVCAYIYIYTHKHTHTYICCDRMKLKSKSGVEFRSITCPSLSVDGDSTKTQWLK